MEEPCYENLKHLCKRVLRGGEEELCYDKRQTMRCVPPVQSRVVCSQFNLGIRLGHRQSWAPY